MKKVLLIIICLLGVMVTNAQDPHFSQFFSSPLTLNPANTGKFDGIIRIAGNYRNQWPSINNAYNTQTASVDFRILKSIVDEKDILGLGFYALSDNSANSAVKLSYYSGSIAFHKGLDDDGLQQLGVGLQGTYSNMSINTSVLTFEDQLTNSGFTGITHESFSGQTLSSNYYDVNAGLLYSGSDGNKTNYYVGVSMYHFNKPTQKFTAGATYFLNPRYTFTAGGSFPVADNMNLHLSGLQNLQGGASESLIGGALQFIATPDDTKPTSFYAGSWIRIGDAIIPYLGLEWDDFRIGASYDINTSSLKTASQSKGGMEISLIWAYRPDPDKSIRCPKF